MSAAPRLSPHFSPVPITPEMTLPEAAEEYLRIRTSGGQARYIKQTTEHSYRQYVATLTLFFGETKLRDIHWYNLKQYQEARVSGTEPFIRRRRPHEEPGPCPAKPARANQELQLLCLLKRRAQCWTPNDAMYHERLQEAESDVPRALTVDEQMRWLSVSRSNPRWIAVHWYSLLSFHTALSSNEIRALRIGDVNLAGRVLSVPTEGAKNPYRGRTIPLNPHAAFAAEQLLERARTLGCVELQHYVFPFRDIRANHYIPSRPMTVNGVRALWEEVRAATGLKSFRPYDTRHTAITRLMEAGQPINVVMAFAGHINEKMTRHYTHISEQAKVKAIEQAYTFHYPNEQPKPFDKAAITELSSAPTPQPKTASQQDTSASYASAFYTTTHTW